MKNIQNYIIAGMALVIIALILFQPKPITTDLTPFKTQIAIADQEIKELKQSNGALLNRIKSDSAEQVKERSAFKTQINGLQRRQDTRRPQVIQQIDSLPIVKAFIETQDSIILTQAARIDTLESNFSEFRINAKKLQQNFEGIIAAQATQLNAEREISSEYKSQARKAKRGNRVWKALAVALPVGVLLLTQ